MRVQIAAKAARAVRILIVNLDIGNKQDWQKTKGLKLLSAESHRRELALSSLSLLKFYSKKYNN